MKKLTGEISEGDEAEKREPRHCTSPGVVRAGELSGRNWHSATQRSVQAGQVGG